jgi:hypothetical protein
LKQFITGGAMSSSQYKIMFARRLHGMVSSEEHTSLSKLVSASEVNKGATESECPKKSRFSMRRLLGLRSHQKQD